MASIEKRGNSYRIKVSCGYKADGTQAIQRMTWTPDPSMTEKQIEKEVQRQAVLYNIPQKLNKRLQKDHDESIIIKEKSRQRKRIIREFEKPP